MSALLSGELQVHASVNGEPDQSWGRKSTRQCEIGGKQPKPAAYEEGYCAGNKGLSTCRT
jgi:hypothetical protein